MNYLYIMTDFKSIFTKSFGMFILCLGLCRCTTNRYENTAAMNNHDPFDWYHAQTGEKAVAVVIHGLNTNPGKMEFIIDFLTRKGISVINVKLYGHRGDIAEMKNVTSEIWRDEVESAFISAKNHGETNKLPLIFLGFSLGGLLGLEHAQTSDARIYDYAVLLAPAVTLARQTGLVKILFPFGNGFIIPSSAPGAYRANRGASVAAYKALFEINSTLMNAADFQKINIPTLCFVDRRDELVDADRLDDFIKNNRLDEWKLIELEKDKTTARANHYHLIIDAYTAGLETWETVETNLNLFLDDIFEAACR